MDRIGVRRHDRGRRPPVPVDGDEEPATAQTVAPAAVPPTARRGYRPCRPQRPTSTRLTAVDRTSVTFDRAATSGSIRRRRWPRSHRTDGSCCATRTCATAAQAGACRRRPDRRATGTPTSVVASQTDGGRRKGGREVEPYGQPTWRRPGHHLLGVRCAVSVGGGGFDPGYFLYLEDVDLCARLAAVDRPRPRGGDVAHLVSASSRPTARPTGTTWRQVAPKDVPLGELGDAGTSWTTAVVRRRCHTLRARPKARAVGRVGVPASSGRSGARRPRTDRHPPWRWRASVASAFGTAFVAQRAAVAAFASVGVPATWLPLAAAADEVADRPYVAMVGHHAAACGRRCWPPSSAAAWSLPSPR